ncbi:hypothetical protein THRCLA_06780 [Thraustotheca clavata]|uniref:Seipin n=1 Tax=Thraustotheca clavata TaxID=74557 RepID=A0A1V9ZJX8_9STRA|nr:hypothetical protein THRCLA_06780 [Thraustotheca clavata]
MLRPVRFLWSLVLASWPVFTAHVHESLMRLRRYEFAEIISDMSSFSLRWIMRVIQFIIVGIFLFASATAIYAGVYYLIMPAKVLQRPLYFDYGVHSAFASLDTPAAYKSNSQIHLPLALLELTTGDNGRDQWKYGDTVETNEVKVLPLTHLTKYDVVLDFEFAQSSVNEHIGMFMVRTQALAEEKHVLATSARPTFVRKSHWVVELASQVLFIMPTLVFGYDASLSQRRTITVINGFEERRVRAVEEIQVELSHPNVQIVSASVSILAQLSGIRYFMYHWFLSTAVIAVLNIAFFEIFWVFAIYLYVTFPTLPSLDPDVIPTDEEQEPPEEIDDEEEMPQVYETELILPPSPHPAEPTKPKEPTEVRQRIVPEEISA